MRSTMLVQQIIDEAQGPQGGWQCEKDHAGYIWPTECRDASGSLPLKRL
jgi:hypothetical protein